MAKISLKQRGFSIIELLLIIIIIGVIGFVGWFVYNSKKTTDSSYNNAANTQVAKPVESKSKATTQSAGYLDIKEWGVRVNVTKADNLTNVSYKMANDTVVFNSDQQKAIKSCKDLNPETVWGLNRQMTGSLKDPSGSAISDSSADGMTDAYKHIGDYYYSSVYPMAGCDAAHDKIGAIDSAYKAIFQTLVKE